MMHELWWMARELLVGESGSVRVRTGLPLAWTLGVCLAAAVFLGSPGQVNAPCNGGSHSFSGCSDGACRQWCQIIHGCTSGACTQPDICACG